MSRGLGKKEIAPAVLGGMRTGAKSWNDLHGTWANKAPEYWFTVSVAQALQRHLDDSKKWVCVEPRMADIVAADLSNASGTYLAGLRLKGRCDLAVQRANEETFAAIEIKIRAYSFTKSIADDVRRLCLLLDPRVSSSIAVCCLAIYTDASRSSKGGARLRLLEQFDSFKDSTKALASEFKVDVEHDFRLGRDPDAGLRKVDVDYWGVQCISLTRKIGRTPR